MSKYVKKPVVVEAVKWNGNNIEEVKAFMKEQLDKLHFESMDAYKKWENIKFDM